jgi:hypothetical protein
MQFVLAEYSVAYGAVAENSESSIVGRVEAVAVSRY